MPMPAGSTSGWILPLAGLVVPALHIFWSGGWFFGLLIALGAYAVFMRTDASRLSAAEFDAITAGATASEEAVSGVTGAQPA